MVFVVLLDVVVRETHLTREWSALQLADILADSSKRLRHCKKPRTTLERPGFLAKKAI